MPAQGLDLALLYLAQATAKLVQTCLMVHLHHSLASTGVLHWLIPFGLHPTLKNLSAVETISVWGFKTQIWEYDNLVSIIQIYPNAVLLWMGSEEKPYHKSYLESVQVRNPVAPLLVYLDAAEEVDCLSLLGEVLWFCYTSNLWSSSGRQALLVTRPGSCHDHNFLPFTHIFDEGLELFLSVPLLEIHSLATLPFLPSYHCFQGFLYSWI